jgi:hypothetical protein
VISKAFFMFVKFKQINRFSFVALRKDFEFRRPT